MRTALVAIAAGFLVAGGAGATPAAHTFPKLLVREEGASITIDVAHDDLDEAAASLTIYAPAGYGANLARPPGTAIGTARGLVTAPDLGLAQIVVSGSVRARSPETTVSPAGEAVTLAEAAERCTGSRAHAAYWVLTLRGSGRTLELPLFADSATPDAARFASATIKGCLPPPDVSPETPGRAPLGYELARLAITFRDVFRAVPVGERRWRLVETEYARGGDTPNPADRSEAQAIVYAGSSVTLARPQTTVLGGLATITLRGRTGIPASADPSYRLYRGSARSSLRASFPLWVIGRTLEVRFQLPQTRTKQVIYVQARGSIETLGLGPSFCRPTFRPAGIPCVYATRMGGVARSAIRRVVIPPDR